MGMAGDSLFAGGQVYPHATAAALIGPLRLTLPCQPPSTIYNGLATALRKHPKFKGIVVTRRGDEVYLRRKK
jgi:hypothetical protein